MANPKLTCVTLPNGDKQFIEEYPNEGHSPGAKYRDPHTLEMIVPTNTRIIPSNAVAAALRESPALRAAHDAEIAAKG